MLVIQSHWGLQHLPFADEVERSAYFPAETHEEALARLHYVIDHGRRACIIEGDSGSGKTFLSRLLGDLTRERGLAGVWLNVRGATEQQVLDCLAEALAISSSSPISWTRIGQGLQEQVLDRRQLLIACDDADHATPDSLEQLRGLIDRFGRGVTIVLTSRSASVGRLHHRFAGISELRVSLEPWSLEDAIAYLNGSIEAAGGDARIFDTDALVRIHERAQGRPRDMSRLARLSLLAGAGDHLDAVDEATVDSVADELIGGL